ncbi:hypothetical protein Amsp01_104630 [Amycolatopsis sp. NBRC 101858]|nr:hypothetical protein Amsp01_104630 [Amycolatopsis sp. NBRC 101858]
MDVKKIGRIPDGGGRRAHGRAQREATRDRHARTGYNAWACRKAFAGNTERTAALAPWLEHYNTQRRPSALGGHPPISRLQPT